MNGVDGIERRRIKVLLVVVVVVQLATHAARLISRPLNGSFGIHPLLTISMTTFHQGYIKDHLMKEYGSII